ncbi:MAG: glycogen-binding domain-containing protein [Desulfobacterales bacterium]|nr:MAG: glycogen-binding domain-containing protein [Desulfobacterales bacterium]
MKDYMISMFIDDELSLDEKIDFVEAVHSDMTFKDETVDLLHQEKLIRSEVVARVPGVAIQAKRKFAYALLRPLGLFASGLAAAAIILFFTVDPPARRTVPYRFVIYQPDVDRAEITGSFTGWDAIPMKPKGTSGYWEIILELPDGEHRFGYILEGRRRMADPTIPTREKDDFGGENSILEVHV